MAEGVRAPAQPPGPLGTHNSVADGDVAGRRRLITVSSALVALAWFALDQVTKVLAVARLEDPGRAVDLGLMDLRVVRNPGGAFSIPGFPGMFVLVTVVVLVLVIRSLRTTDTVALAVAYGLVSGGALGNVADRMLRAPGFPNGHVVDFFDLGWWPVFNIADIGIVSGAGALAVLLTVAGRREDEDVEADGRAARQGPAVGGARPARDARSDGGGGAREAGRER